LSRVTRIGIISDTHIHHLKDVPSSLLDSLKGFDLIIHLGDFVSLDLVDYFRGFNNFYGIAGNHDPRTIKAILRRSDVIEVNGKRLGLLHGYWFPLFCEHRSLARFKNEKVDAILYGHTHVIRNEMVNNILFFNPGSACALWPAPWKTYGILNVGETITGEIVSFAKNDKGGFSKYTDSIVSRDTILRWVCGSPRLPDYSMKSPVRAGQLDDLRLKCRESQWPE
jgi:putative phosphoesterase